MLDQTPAQTTRLLWDLYDPARVWTPFAIAGLAAAIALFIFNRFAREWKDADA
jgi:hypothetical protein